MLGRGRARGRVGARARRFLASRPSRSDGASAFALLLLAARHVASTGRLSRRPRTRGGRSGMMLGTALGASIAGAVLHGALYPNSPIFGRVISAVPSRDGQLALTFDDGPNPVATPAILDALGERGVKASFFVLGRHTERWPQLVRRMADE